MHHDDRQSLLRNEEKEEFPVKNALLKALGDYTILRDSVWQDQEKDATWMNNEDIGLFAIEDAVKRKFTGIFGQQKDKIYAKNVNAAHTELEVLNIAQEILNIKGNERLKFLVANALRSPLGISEQDLQLTLSESKSNTLIDKEMVLKDVMAPFNTNTYRQLGYDIDRKKTAVMFIEDVVLNKINNRRNEILHGGSYAPPKPNETHAEPSAPEQELPRRRSEPR